MALSHRLEIRQGQGLVITPQLQQAIKLLQLSSLELDAYVDGELTATESAAFEAALPGCPDCRRRLEETRAMSGFLRDLPTERAPDLLRAKIERELRAISSASKPRALF